MKNCRWQYRRHRHSCSSHSGEASRLKVKKSKSYENGKKSYMSDVIGKSSAKKHEKSILKSAKESKKYKKKNKSSGYLYRLLSIHKIIKDTFSWMHFFFRLSIEPVSKEKREDAVRNLEKLTSTEDVRHRATSPSSKSTVVMEVSTVQKVVQIIEKDPHVARTPRETVTYRFLPENERKFEFVVRSRSDDGSRAIETD